MSFFPYLLIQRCIKGAQKNRLIETGLLVSTTYVLTEK